MRNNIIIKVLLATVVILAIGYLGINIYDHFQDKKPSVIKYPDINSAKYEFTIMNTGNVLYTDKYEQYGEMPGKRFFLLHGYYEYMGKEFTERKHDLPLDENILGEIKIVRR